MLHCPGYCAAMTTLREVKVRFAPEDLEAIDRLAQTAGKSRSEYLRDLVTGNTNTLQTPMDFHRLVAGAHRSTSGHLDVRQVQAVVAYVVTELLGAGGGVARGA